MTRNFDKSIDATRRLESAIPGGAHAYARGAGQYPEFMPVVIQSGSGFE